MESTKTQAIDRVALLGILGFVFQAFLEKRLISRDSNSYDTIIW